MFLDRSSKCTTYPATPASLSANGFIDTFYVSCCIQKCWTQKELANQIDIRFAQLNKYECGMHIPPIEKLVQLGDVLGVTLDYLIMGNRVQIQTLRNMRLIERLQELEGFGSGDQEVIITMIDAMIVKQRVESAVTPFKRLQASG